jgi:hypothetical protein
MAGAALPFGAAALGAQGCGDGGMVTEEDGAAPDANKDAGPGKVVTLHPDAAALPGETECQVVVTTGIPVKAAAHLPVCTSIPYATNPPSGGDHWPAWASYAEYAAPVPREMYTHNLEHGGVVITYRATDASPEVKAALEGAFKNAVDPFCVINGPVATRAVLTPDPDIPTPIAASAWGATYTATCIDLPSLTAFIADRIGHGTEPLCGDGYNPVTTVMACKDGG